MLFSCEPSVKEKEEIAILTCNIMGESRNMDAAFRIKEINTAREQMGEDRFLGTDDEILNSFELGLCKELVLNDKKYKTKLENAYYAKYAEKGVEVNHPGADREIKENAEILFTVGSSGEISVNGSRIDISAARENVERIIAENPQQNLSVVISADQSTDTDVIIRLMDAARLAGVMSISLRWLKKKLSFI